MNSVCLLFLGVRVIVSSDHAQTHHTLYESTGWGIVRLQETDIHSSSGNRTCNPSKLAAAERLLRRRSHRDRHVFQFLIVWTVLGCPWCLWWASRVTRHSVCEPPCSVLYVSQEGELRYVDMRLHINWKLCYACYPAAPFIFQPQMYGGTRCWVFIQSMWYGFIVKMHWSRLFCFWERNWSGLLIALYVHVELWVFTKSTTQLKYDSLWEPVQSPDGYLWFPSYACSVRFKMPPPPIVFSLLGLVGLERFDRCCFPWTTKNICNKEFQKRVEVLGLLTEFVHQFAFGFIRCVAVKYSDVSKERTVYKCTVTEIVDRGNIFFPTSGHLATLRCIIRDEDNHLFIWERLQSSEE
jgi:hypothetical protein